MIDAGDHDGIVLDTKLDDVAALAEADRELAQIVGRSARPGGHAGEGPKRSLDITSGAPGGALTALCQEISQPHQISLGVGGQLNPVDHRFRASAASNASSNVLSASSSGIDTPVRSYFSRAIRACSRW